MNGNNLAQMTNTFQIFQIEQKLLKREGSLEEEFKDFLGNKKRKIGWRMDEI